MKTLVAVEDPDDGARATMLRRLAAAFRRAGMLGGRRQSP